MATVNSTPDQTEVDPEEKVPSRLWIKFGAGVLVVGAEVALGALGGSHPTAAVTATEGVLRGAGLTISAGIVAESVAMNWRYRRREQRRAEIGNGEGPSGSELVSAGLRGLDDLGPLRTDREWSFDGAAVKTLDHSTQLQLFWRHQSTEANRAELRVGVTLDASDKDSLADSIAHPETWRSIPGSDAERVEMLTVLPAVVPDLIAASQGRPDSQQTWSDDVPARETALLQGLMKESIQASEAAGWTVEKVATVTDRNEGRRLSVDWVDAGRGSTISAILDASTPESTARSVAELGAAIHQISADLPSPLDSLELRTSLCQEAPRACRIAQELGAVEAAYASAPSKRTQQVSPTQLPGLNPSQTTAIDVVTMARSPSAGQNRRAAESTRGHA